MECFEQKLKKGSQNVYINSVQINGTPGYTCPALWNDFYLQAFVKFGFCPCKAQPQYLNKLFFICVYVRHRITEIFDIRQILMKTMESYEDKNA